MIHDGPPPALGNSESRAGRSTAPGRWRRLGLFRVNAGRGREVEAFGFGQRSFTGNFQESTVTQATEGRDSDSEDKDLLNCQNASDRSHITSVMKYHQ